MTRLSRFAPEGKALRVKRAAVAVSGGRDSLALCLLLNRWLQESRQAGEAGFRFSEREPSLLALTVDHQLRGEESAKEARQVAEWMAEHAIEHRTLRPSCESDRRAAPITGTRNIQERARNLRFHLLQRACRDAGASHLFLGHHSGDQAETVLMRLYRSSGLEGLCGIQPWSLRRTLHQGQMQDLHVLRPMLPVPRSAMGPTLQELSVTDLDRTPKNLESDTLWIDDPSNANEAFDRVRARRGVAQLYGGHDKELASEFCSLTDGMRNVSMAVAQAALAPVSFYPLPRRDCSTPHKQRPHIVAELDARALAMLPEPLRVRCMTLCLQAVASGEHGNDDVGSEVDFGGVIQSNSRSNALVSTSATGVLQHIRGVGASPPRAHKVIAVLEEVMRLGGEPPTRLIQVHRCSLVRPREAARVGLGGRNDTLVLVDDKLLSEIKDSSNK